MSFKDLARIEGYDLDATEKRAEFLEAENRGYKEVVTSCHIAEITQENSRLKEAIKNLLDIIEKISNLISKYKSG